MHELDAKMAAILLGEKRPEGRTPTGRRRADRERWAKTIFAPLRSWCLALRAADSRIAPGAEVEMDLPFAVEQIRSAAGYSRLSRPRAGAWLWTRSLATPWPGSDSGK